METAPPIVEEAPPTTPLWEDFVDIFFAPAQVFARRAEGRFGIQNAPGGAEMSAENLEQMRRFGTISAVIGALIVVPISVFLAGFVLWLLAKFVDSVASYAAVIMIVTYANFPRVLQGVVGMVQGLVLSPDSIYDVSIGLSRFVPREDTNPLLLALVDRVDLFTIWVAILVAIGVHVVGRVPKGFAYLVAAIMWLLGILPALIPMLISGAAG